MASGKPIAVIAALIGNLIIAIGKLGAGLIANSAAMLAEAAHSFSDVGNQILLLVGVARSKRPVSERYPFGTSRSQYFWSFMVAVLLFGGAGVYSLLEGIEKWRHPHELNDIGLSLAILGIAFVIESITLGIAIRQAVVQARLDKARNVREFLEVNRDATLLTIIVEDGLALVGLPIAGLAILLSSTTGDSRFDAGGSIVIGLMLMGFAFFLGNEIRELLIGRGISKPDAQEIRRVILKHPRVDRIHTLSAMHLGHDAVLLGLEIVFKDTSQVTQDLEVLDAQVRAAVPDIKYAFLEPHSMQNPASKT